MSAAVETSVFRGTLGFFEQIGVYDVVLPFLLIFTLVYAILEKTQIFGKEKVEGKEYTRKNLNAMAAFVIAFFVVASTRLVAIINEVLANTVLLLILSITFLMLAGSFHTGSEEFFLKDGWKTFFMVLMFIGIVLIFMHALGWLQLLYNYVAYSFDTVAVSSIILVIVIVLFIFYVTKSPKTEKKDKEE